MTTSEIAAMADALSWARTSLDDPGSAKSTAETIELIDAALAPYWAEQDAEHAAHNVL